MRRPRGEGLVELAEAELAARPDHDLRAEPREVHRAGRGGGEVVEDEVAVGGAVDRVVADVLEAEVVGDRAAVDLPVDPGEGAGAERHHRGAVERELEAQDVAAEHPEVGEQVVAEVDRLGALQVRVAGHRPVAVALGELEQAAHRRAEPARSPAASAPARPSPRRSRPGRCASGRCAACRPAGRSPPRAVARSPCGCPRRPPRTRSHALHLARRPARGRRRSAPARPRRARRSAAAPARAPATGRCRRAPAASRTRSSG